MQLLAKFKNILYMGFGATLNFRKFKVTLNPMYRICLNFAKSCISLANDVLPYSECHSINRHFTYLFISLEYCDFALCRKLSLNVRGLNGSRKRRQVFRWLHQRKSDIIFLQETYSSRDTIGRWEAERGGEIVSSHGSLLIAEES